MKKIVFLIIIGLASITVLAQNATGAPMQNISTDSNVMYRLFSTRNMGRVWQIQWSTEVTDRIVIPIH